MKITSKQLVDIFAIKAEVADKWVEPLNHTFERFNILLPLQVAAFLAQVGHESGHLKFVEENLNYSAEALVKTWPTRFKATEAAKYGRKPELIANKVYAGRFGNGDEKSGDGWKYRGRGLIQITFKDNYIACGVGLGVDFVKTPELLASAEYAALSAGWYWDSRKLNALAAAQQFELITRKINGGLNGQADRLKLYAIAKKVLGC